MAPTGWVVTTTAQGLLLESFFLADPWLIFAAPCLWLCFFAWRLSSEFFLAYWQLLKVLRLFSATQRLGISLGGFGYFWRLFLADPCLPLEIPQLCLEALTQRPCIFAWQLCLNDWWLFLTASLLGSFAQQVFQKRCGFLAALKILMLTWQLSLASLLSGFAQRLLPEAHHLFLTALRIFQRLCGFDWRLCGFARRLCGFARRLCSMALLKRCSWRPWLTDLIEIFAGKSFSQRFRSAA